MNATLRDALHDEFPVLYRERPEFWILDGWEPLVRRLSAHLEPLIGAQPPEQRAYAVQVKEKCGGLRFYLGGRAWTDAMKLGIEEAELAAWKTCEECGRAGMLRDSTCWFATRCDDHAPLHSVQVRENETLNEARARAARSTR